MPVQVSVQVGRRVRSLRKQKGFTQGYLASRAEITRESLVKFETGRQELRINALARICKVLKVTLSEIVDGIT